jgi:hypothetical protein
VIRRGVLPKLRPPAQGTNRSSATSCSSAFISGGTPSADDFHGWATPVATDPRKTRDERPRRRTGSSRSTSSRRRCAQPRRSGVRHEGVRGRAQGGPAVEEEAPRGELGPSVRLRPPMPLAVGRPPLAVGRLPPADARSPMPPLAPGGRRRTAHEQGAHWYGALSS